MGESTVTSNVKDICSLENAIDGCIADDEAYNVRGYGSKKELSSLMVLRLAFQSLGVVYGDLSTSPLYVFNAIYSTEIPDREEVMGVLSLIIYSLILIPLIKYVFIVMRANNHGEGGTFAIYSLICRHAKLNAMPNQDHTDEKLTTYKRRAIDDKCIAGRVTKWLERKYYRRNALLVIVLVGTCMIIGDGIFTPSISVISSVGGIREEYPDLGKGTIVSIAIILLVALFGVQHYGTDKVGWLFAPAVFLWLLTIGAIGGYNIFKYDVHVLTAFSPLNIVRYFKKDKKKSWASLAGIMVCITGSEAIFADLGHFSTLSVQVAFTAVVLPCLLLQYMGQAAYLIHHPNDVNNAFYASAPTVLHWPLLFIATVAAVIASQACITATFSVIKQSVALGCFPRVKILHTSRDISGQVYIPEINWLLMVLCVLVTAGFNDTDSLANAYGFSVLIVMLVTTALMALVMLIVWRTHWFFIFLFTSFFTFVELVFFSSMMFKIGQGAWAPLVIATIFLTVMYVWHYGSVKRYEFEMASKVSVSWIARLGPSLGLVRVPGVGLVYTQLVSGVPHIFSHLITHVPAVHSVMVFVCIKYLPVNTVPQEERFFVKRIGSKQFSMFRCVARYGYKDLHKKDDSFENMLFEALSSFIRCESLMESFMDSEISYDEDQPGAGHNANATSLEIASASLSQTSEGFHEEEQQPIGFFMPIHDTVEDELRFLQSCWDSGIVHILGNTVISAREGSSFVKKIAVNIIYAFLRKICRDNSFIFHVPQESLLNVGQICKI